MVPLASSVYIGVDVGGTFTDIVFFSEETSQVEILKVPTTSKNPEEAILGALSRLGHDPSSVKLVNHATTIATNALLTRTRLAKAAFVTNRGFRDIIEIGRQRRLRYTTSTQRGRLH